MTDRSPGIGDALVFIKERIPGSWNQYPAQVVDYWPGQPPGPHPALTLVYWDGTHRPEPGGSPLLAPLRRLLLGPIKDGTMRADGAWLRASEVRHRDHWSGDSWGEFWCWPDEGWRSSFYISDLPTPGQPSR